MTQEMRQDATTAQNTAQAFLDLLERRGIDFFFANAGTDFASLVDAFAGRQEQGRLRPVPLTVPHEIPLVSMAHGYYLATGRPQAAMVHVNVGTANAIGPLIAASRSRIPILFCAGRTPINEAGPTGARSAYIHWGQESFDQAGLVREYVKWDYELKNPDQIETVVDRGLALAMTEPRGPVYLTLPREILAAPGPGLEFSTRLRHDPVRFRPPADKLGEAAELLARARRPLVIASFSGRTRAGVQALVNLADKLSPAVVCFNPEYMNFPLGHDCHQGYSPSPFLSEADVILVVESDVPWYPGSMPAPDRAVVIQIGVDPLFSRYPVRGFPADITLPGEAAEVLPILAEAAAGHSDFDQKAAQSRRRELKDRHDTMIRRWQEKAEKAALRSPVDFRWLAYNLRQVLGEEALLINEYDNKLKEYMGPRPETYFCISHAGFLGWGLGAALGMKLARPDELVAAVVGDGCYIFGVPTACHLVAASQNLPLLIIIHNNQGYNAVKGAALGLHPQGRAARTGNFPLTRLTPAPEYEKIVEAFGGYGERVETAAQVRPALNRALRAVREEKRQALLNVVCRPV